MNLRVVSIAVFGCLLLFTSCVTTKKYDEAVSLKDYYKSESESLAEVEEENDELKQKLKTTEAQLKQSYLELEELTIRNDRLNSENADLRKRYDQLLEQNKTLLSTASYEKQSLQELLITKQEELNEKETALADAQFELDEREANLALLRANLDEREARVNELQASLRETQGQMSQLKANIKEALLGFSAKDLTVTEVDGKLYVSMSQNLLFRSGSDKIDNKGKQALQQLAAVLNDNPDIDITVEGHTDSDGSATLNWDLSVSRATTVVKVLTDNGVDPTRITASGRGLYSPVAPNDSADNKARNRRTEIILSPRLQSIFDIINQ
ncbi:MAG: OmpA family protein [Bacteroidetes bacterium]|nr:OmpA family protein [Bacteroidota bacterium]